MSIPIPSPTPNVGLITDPKIRKIAGAVFYALSILASVATLFFLFFPEATLGSDIPERIIAFITAAVSFLTGTFGFTVTLPNVPKTKPAQDVAVIAVPDKE